MNALAVNVIIKASAKKERPPGYFIVINVVFAIPLETSSSKKFQKNLDSRAIKVIYNKFFLNFLLLDVSSGIARTTFIAIKKPGGLSFFAEVFIITFTAKAFIPGAFMYSYLPQTS